MTNENKILVIGGCRSGKSGHALELAEAAGPRRIFVATCVPHDDEMRDRVARHQRDRDDSWQTLEIPVDLAGAIRDYSATADVMLIDCLTLWLSNLLMQSEDVAVIRGQIDNLADAITRAPRAVVLVSNEVGAGIVPENRLARLYRDLAGWANQAMAAACDRVVWTVAGIPVTIKPVTEKSVP
ncbi:adenosylcobinamide kinase/adenosylcobinamide phosphate guanyltransferase [Desulfosarcina ovata subsp. sediminis]|uniref:Adenosylcobinamide kinase n=1 Tax=Desulfosarcina ovata subsp. sediminis TaxID=885957 RepID=A0A5K7ZEK6_9BACT|nr:bifunctional adenosylcobinamide kinase/adenosylcobinamide-phosphate guanylyltransferase [Desulfosarcina ovata]BBO80492.1 adenosylcobinamide kinase/adenosylcobinamide phosphate guanyltransferase [Desulfosarcina ovata subsp. sediminis]